MGFKLRKKSTSENNRTNGNTFATKLKSQLDQFSYVFGETEKSKPLILGAMFFLVISLFVLIYLFYSVPRNNDLTRSIGDLRLLSQTISRQATEVTTTGTEESISNLLKSQQEFQKNLQLVNNIHSKTDALKNVDAQWAGISKNIDLIVAQKAMITKLYDTNLAINDVIPGIQAQYNLMVDQMARQNYPSSQVVIAKNQVFIAERILRSINTVLAGYNVNSRESADDFSADAQTFGLYLNAQLNGNADLGVVRVSEPNLRVMLENIKTEYDSVLKFAASTLLNNSQQIVQVREASATIFNNSDNLLSNLNKLSGGSSLEIALPGLFLLTALAGFLYCVFKLLTLRGVSDKERVTRLQDEYDRNQNAILRLLDEIADLADGDLRSYATVSEDFTGAIADSINFAIDQLRDLVSRINETSQEVAQYTANTQSITNQLAEASEHQAQEIAGASAAINEMAASIDEVSGNAEESARVAERSVEIASKGVQVVNRSIEGMDIIREQIQETSKRIKRLGESSQEIGNIVALINDIADQTNILALNAAIQASMAGEAGRGFAVVADEVQRLAERSASATKQIETLVKTIQTDTNEAVISMEQTTVEVVRGANLSKDAGVALDEIQNVSNTLAQLIANISEAAKLQSASASHIALTMNVVQDITSQTTSATFDTARSVSELANMAESLRESVTDFKLPE